MQPQDMFHGICGAATEPCITRSPSGQQATTGPVRTHPAHGQHTDTGELSHLTQVFVTHNAPLGAICADGAEFGAMAVASIHSMGGSYRGTRRAPTPTPQRHTPPPF